MNIRLIYFILLLMNCVEAKSAMPIDSLPVTQEIRYSAKDANEVFLVWGINNWKFQKKDFHPEGTYMKGNLMCTPMKLNDGVFSTKLKVPTNTMVDYVFWITKGPLKLNANVWDLNKAPQKDYHTLALNDNITIIESDIVIKPNVSVTLMDFSWQLLFIVTTLSLIFLAIKKYRFKDILLKPSPGRIIIAGSGILLLALFLIRTSILSLSWGIYFHPFEFIPKALPAGFYDFLYVSVLTLVFLIFLFAFRKFSYIKSAIISFFISVGLFSLIAGILNIRIVEMLGNPFNYQWLYYSDFLNSVESKAALSSNISPTYIINIVVICMAAIIATILLLYFTELLLHKFKIKKILIVILIVINLGYMALAQKAISESEWSYDKLSNPVTAFIASVNPFSRNPALFTMEIPDSLNTFGKPKVENLTDRFKGLSQNIKNVIVFVLESTPAEYVQPYNNQFNTTPELEKYASSSIVFENIYAHAPATNKSMVSLLGSIYPWLSYTSITQDFPSINIPTLSSELKKHGFRTAFFNSADNHFQKADEFLANRKFDVVKDCKTLPCKQQFEIEDDKMLPLNGINDECTGEELMTWIKKDSGKPFFGMIWTYQTHYPYYASGDEIKYDTPDPLFNRYLNAVHHSDMVLGNLLEELKRKDLFESTLVVVVGDHGEAFGRHNQLTHASRIYEENVHVPCVFINPAFKKETNVAIGGIIDIAPTIMNILGLPVASEWHGNSLFTANENDRVYFFSPWSDYLFGYREGDRKYIFNATKNITEIYDLKTDQYETNNLAPELPAEVEFCHKRLAAWVQYSNKFMEGKLNPILKAMVAK